MPATAAAAPGPWPPGLPGATGLDGLGAVASTPAAPCLTVASKAIGIVGSGLVQRAISSTSSNRWEISQEVLKSCKLIVYIYILCIYIMCTYIRTHTLSSVQHLACCGATAAARDALCCHLEPRQEARFAQATTRSSATGLQHLPACCLVMDGMLAGARGHRGQEPVRSLIGHQDARRRATWCHIIAPIVQTQQHVVCTWHVPRPALSWTWVGTGRALAAGQALARSHLSAVASSRAEGVSRREGGPS